jgi:hypothetical protein
MSRDNAPLSAGLLRNLSDRQYEKRKLAALEIETRCPRGAPGARARTLVSVPKALLAPRHA